jgi:hypothetical protein
LEEYNFKVHEENGEKSVSWRIFGLKGVEMEKTA